MSSHSAPRGRSLRESGFTLVEMMVAMAIGLVLALGFAVSFVNLKSTFKTQDSLSQLQDNERLTMAFLTASVEEAGYFPDTVPPSKTRLMQISAVTPATADSGYGSTVAGQYLLGTVGTSPASDSLSTVYASAPGDGMLTCQGGTNATASTITIRNIFYVDPAQNALGCVVYNGSSKTTAPGAAFTPLVSNVSSMTVSYAVDTDGDGVADTYMTAATVTSTGHWDTIKAVRVTVNFLNPNAASGGGAATIAWTQTINVMNNR